MLKPALLYKDELNKKFAEQLYSQDYFLYTGCDGTWVPEIKADEGTYQYVILNKDNQVIGYFAYSINYFNDTVHNFGLYSFNKGNPIIGIDLIKKMKELIKYHHRIEWRMIAGNPVKRHYDKFCKRYNGNVVCLHDVTKNLKGQYVDEYIYEIINKGVISI